MTYCAQRLAASRRRRASPEPRAGARGVDVLNASRHHGDDGSPRRRRALADGGVLNASRHHGDDGPLHDRALRVVSDVLNASRHHGDDGPPHEGGEGAGGGVLNASRHHGDDGATSDALRIPRRVCSTPRGITATTGPRQVVHFTRHLRAQRLAASRRRRAGHRPRRQHRRHVLNASRHHGDDGQSQPEPRRGSYCAQRLAASRRRRTHRRTPQRGSTRVLNASRHHGDDGLEAALVGAQPRELVLNASRHHGDDGREAQLGCQPIAACSTPRGITATTGPVEAEVVVDHLRVLNASRHHGDDGSRHCRRSIHACLVLNASRHHGDDGTYGREPFRQCTRVCSTPRGITATTGRFERGELEVVSRCSTPRGITATTGRARRRSPRRGRGAQRLAASRRRRDDERAALDAAAKRCSTPRGITATTGPEVDRARHREVVLNASRHHGDDGVGHLVNPQAALDVLNASRHHGDDGRPSA